MQLSFYICNQLKSKQNLKVKFTPWWITTHNLVKHQDRSLLETEAWKNKNYLKFNFPHPMCLLRQT